MVKSRNLEEHSVSVIFVSIYLLVSVLFSSIFFLNFTFVLIFAHYLVLVILLFSSSNFVLVFALSVIEFCQLQWKIAFLAAFWGILGQPVTYTRHFSFIKKPMVDFLLQLVIIELYRLALTAMQCV